MPRANRTINSQNQTMQPAPKAFGGSKRGAETAKQKGTRPVPPGKRSGVNDAKQSGELPVLFPPGKRGNVEKVKSTHQFRDFPSGSRAGVKTASQKPAKGFTKGNSRAANTQVAKPRNKAF